MNEYIQRNLGFYFDGGFSQMVSDAKLDEEEIKKWANLAVLFSHCFENIESMPLEKKEDAFCIVEALYTKIEVDLMFGEIDKSTVDEIFEGYDIDRREYQLIIQKGISLIEEHGLDLYKRINS